MLNWWTDRIDSYNRKIEKYNKRYEDKLYSEYLVRKKRHVKFVHFYLEENYPDCSEEFRNGFAEAITDICRPGIGMGAYRFMQPLTKKLLGFSAYKDFDVTK